MKTRKLLTLTVAVALMSCGSMAYAGIVTQGTFTGGDASEGLDLDGSFLYAIDMGWTGAAPAGGGTVRDATFTNPNSTAGFTQVGNNNDDQYTITYGATTNDDTLENIMDNRLKTYGYQYPVGGTFTGLTVGVPYTLQMGFQKPGYNTMWDVTMSDDDSTVELLVDNMIIGDSATTAILVTYEFTPVEADGTWIQIQVYAGTEQGDDTVPEGHDERYPSIGLMTLEIIPEPVTLSILAIGALATLLRRKRR